MKLLATLSILIFLAMTTQSTLYDFTSDSVKEWRVVDDVVMGGRSSGNFKINKDGNGVFYGNVSTENNGGFSSMRHALETLNTSDYKKVVLKIKGDGKDYQFRLKPNASNYFSYITTFSTDGTWQEIEIPFKKLYASFRGRVLDMPNFDGNQIEEITFLIANKRNENFQLELDWIQLK